jgi:hypothetical protein
VIVVPVREKDVVDAEPRWRPAVEASEQRDDGVRFAVCRRIDQVEPVALAHGVGLDDRRAQAPQPVGDAFKLHDASAGRRWRRRLAARRPPPPQGLRSRALRLRGPVDRSRGWRPAVVIDPRDAATRLVGERRVAGAGQPTVDRVRRGDADEEGLAVLRCDLHANGVGPAEELLPPIRAVGGQPVVIGAGRRAKDRSSSHRGTMLWLSRNTFSGS